MKCEIIGIVGKATPSPVRCTEYAKFNVSVEGLSPLACCKFHKNAMISFWSICYDVKVIPIGTN